MWCVEFCDLLCSETKSRARLVLKRQLCSSRKLSTELRAHIAESRIDRSIVIYSLLPPLPPFITISVRAIAPCAGYFSNPENFSTWTRNWIKILLCCVVCVSRQPTSGASRQISSRVEDGREKKADYEFEPFRGDHSTQSVHT